MKNIKTPTEIYQRIKENIKYEWKIAFFSAFFLGIFIHMPGILRDIPNHDGLDSIYFSQNMITSGRWFLSSACGVSSFFTLPWVIGVLSVFYLAVSTVVLVELLEIHKMRNIVLISGLFVSFPAFVSMYAYIFTMDGYCLGILLSVLAPLFVKKLRYGAWVGGICLGLSLGIYQAYLPFAILLSIYSIFLIWEKGTEKAKKIKTLFTYFFMGIIGLGFYGIALKILLLVQGKNLSGYQGIGEIAGTIEVTFFERLSHLYHDFFAFTLKGNVLFRKDISGVAMCFLISIFLITFIYQAFQKQWYKKTAFYMSIVGSVLIIPIAFNIILLVSPNVEYHLLMRYQWVLIPILILAYLEHCGEKEKTESWKTYGEWVVLVSLGVLIFHYVLVDNIAYFNLEKKYEKTYAYCVRLLDRMEQTEGYYQGIPIAMIGVVSDEQYPKTDITGNVTSHMIGVSGDTLLYTRRNYQAFIKHYLGATIDFVTDEEMLKIYDSKEYKELESFPLKNSMKVVDGILYIKLENQE